MSYLHRPTLSTRNRLLTGTALALSLGFYACGGAIVEDGLPSSKTDSTDNSQKPFENKTPAINVVSIGTGDAISVGEEVVLVGKDFIHKRDGHHAIQFKGRFVDEMNQTITVDYTEKATFHNEGKLSWRLWPNVVFHPEKDRLGYFLGEVRVTNVGRDGTEKTSEPVAIRFDVKPSIIPRLVRPKDGNCQPIVTKTIGGTSFDFSVEAIGLRRATDDAPMKFYWAFMADQWDISDKYGGYDIKDPTSSPVPPERRKGNAFLVEDRVTSGAASDLSEDSSKNFLLRFKDDLLGQGGIKRLKTIAVNDYQLGSMDYDTNVNVTAVDASGKTAHLSIPIRIYQQVEMNYDNNQVPVQRYEPQQVTECIPGSDIGRELQYREDKSESESRSLTWNINGSLGYSLGLPPAQPFIAMPHITGGFGIDISETVTTTNSKSLDFGGRVLPGEYGMFYRQKTKIKRVGKLIGHTKCGQEFDVGEAIVTDWIFSPDLGTGPSCPPPTNLPPAQTFSDGYETTQGVE